MQIWSQFGFDKEKPENKVLHIDEEMPVLRRGKSG